MLIKSVDAILRTLSTPSVVFVCSIYDYEPDSSIGIETGYGLDGPGIDSQWGTRLSAPVQPGLGAHPTSCTMGTVSFPGVKSGRDVPLAPQPLLVPLDMKE
jgi:hypothetical protein